MKQINLHHKRNSLASWRGYTLDELHRQLLANNTAIIIEKNRLIAVASKSFTTNKRKESILSRIAGALSCFDYVTIALNIATKARHLYQTWKRR